MPAGLEVLQTGAAPFTRHGYPLIVTDADIARFFPDLRIGPVRQMTLSPGQEPRWFLIAALRATAAGTHLIRSIGLDYSVGRRHGSINYPYAVRLVVAG